MRAHGGDDFPELENSFPESTSIRAFRERILARYRSNPRPMPWRETNDPYRILVSEFMLQQTQVERVMGKYGGFIDRFPDFHALSGAPLAQVLEAWQGLGYNRRARSLHATATIVVERFDGILPSDPYVLETLPGIGHATARAITAFAFGIPSAFIETNIRRVYIHFFFEGRDRVSDRDILPVAEAALDRDNPRDWHYALMDYGVMLGKTVPNPNTRSTHHHRQSPFEGSLRQVRGAVVRLLSLNGGHMRSVGDMASETGFERERIERAAEALVKDGMIQREKEGFRIG